jgi:transposase
MRGSIVKTIGIDLAKEIFQIQGVDGRGRILFRKRVRRSKLREFMAKQPTCLVGMEACGGAHYWAREFKKLGHEVRLISPQFVKPFVKSNKNDTADAEGICEAVQRPTMRFVPIKGVIQQDIQSVHRVRERLIRQRTALMNEIRGLLAEYGMVLPKGKSALKSGLPKILEDPSNELSDRARRIFFRLYEEIGDMELKMDEYEKEIRQIYRENEICQELTKVEGVGPITATALVAAVSEPGLFKNGREMAAWLGLVPRQHSSGGKSVLLGISKRGDCYLRKLLVHGARSVLKTINVKSEKRRRWIETKKETRGYNRASVALANKNARILWALMARKESYRAA